MEVSTKTTVEVGDPLDDPFGGRGEILFRTPEKICWRAEVEPGVYATCTKTIVDPIYENNRQRLNESEGKKWGDGQIVASIDLPTYYSTILPAIQAGDDKWIKDFLNDSENVRHRTFKGHL